MDVSNRNSECKLQMEYILVNFTILYKKNKVYRKKITKTSFVISHHGQCEFLVEQIKNADYIPEEWQSFRGTEDDSLMDYQYFNN